MEIWSCEFSPDGKYLVTVSEDQTSCVWKIDIGDFRKGGHDEEMEAVLANPNKKKADDEYLSRDGAVRIRKCMSLKAHTMAVTCVDFKNTEIGPVFATCSDDRKVFVYRASKRKQQEAQIYATGSTSVCIEAPDLDETMHVEEYCMLRTREKGYYITYVCLEENGNRLAAVTEDGFFFIWNFVTQELLFQKKLHLSSIEGLRWNQETGMIASCGSDNCVLIFEL